MKNSLLITLLAAVATGAPCAPVRAIAAAPTPEQSEAWLADAAAHERASVEFARKQEAFELAQATASDAAARELEAAERAASRQAYDTARAVAAEVAAANSVGATYRMGRGARAGRALVIPKDASDEKGLTEMEEDLNIMAHILAKAVSSDDRAPRAMGINVVSWGGRAPATPENLYLDGYGAVFFETVEFPLLPPASKETGTAAKEKTSTEWDEARREVFQPARGSGGDPFFVAADTVAFSSSWNDQPAAEYDEARVEDLKKDLITALKNAAHIRKLRSDETVTVVILGIGAGGSAGGAKPVGTTTRKTPRAYNYSYSTTIPGERKREIAPARLVVRARKADADAFQSGKLDFDEFRKKVTLLIY